MAMIGSETLDRILEMRFQNVPLRVIAMRLGIHRDTVKNALSGIEKDGMEPIRPPATNTPARRCPYCGRLVHMPCLACQIAKRK